MEWLQSTSTRIGQNSVNYTTDTTTTTITTTTEDDNHVKNIIKTDQQLLNPRNNLLTIKLSIVKNPLIWISTTVREDRLNFFSLSHEVNLIRQQLET